MCDKQVPSLQTTSQLLSRRMPQIVLRQNEKKSPDVMEGLVSIFSRRNFITSSHNR
jgi:hypothetical protein